LECKLIYIQQLYFNLEIFEIFKNYQLSLQKAYKEVAKELVPAILFPSTAEYRAALEKYLSAHAEHFIESIGRNRWVSLFEEKLLPEVCEIVNNYQKKSAKIYLIFFRLKLNVEVREMILQLAFEMQCLLPSENSSWNA
jgi:hypothetical protein